MHTYRSTLLAGMVTLLSGTLLFCFGRSFGVYVVARFLQGISSAVVWIVGFILFSLYSWQGLR
jgi:predicted MFS family arabinose efflux permease